GRCLALLMREGHGNYAAAVNYIIENSIEYLITVGGDQDFRGGTVFYFYTRDILQGRRVNYYAQGNWPPPNGPEWYIAQREAYEEPVPVSREIAFGPAHRWELVKTIPAAPLSAQHWFIYHRVEQ
nr:hypothetical protein [Verrucomicrobiota bacterium]